MHFLHHNPFAVFLRQHWLAIFLAVAVGIICVGPQLFFILNPGSNYQGLPILSGANEDHYLSRVKEILDGHPFAGSPWFYEYKDNFALIPPTTELIWAAVSLISFLSVVNTAILMKFLLPMILFLLVYALIYKLTGGRDLAAKITAGTGALFVTLGYDLIDYHTVWNVLRGSAHPDAFLVWTRPVNPITGAMILFALLLVLWSLVENVNGRKVALLSFLFAFGVYTYFFTWGLGLSIIGVLILIYFFQRRFDLVKMLIVSLLVSGLLVIPYFYAAFVSSQSPWYVDSSARTGLFHGSQLIVNKVLLASLIIFALLSLLLYWKRKQIKIEQQDWWWFCLALLLAGQWAFNQQVITGLMVWPYHFVQYTIPLSIVVTMVMLYRVVRPRSNMTWLAAVTGIAIASLGYGLYVQVSSYRVNFAGFRDMQPVMGVLSWLDDNTEKESVVLMLDERAMVGLLITMFTHNNVYVSPNVVSLVPIERLAHNYMVEMRFKDVSPDNSQMYIDNEIIRYKSFFGGLVDFKEIITTGVYLRNKDIVPARYPDFYKNDFYSELKKYRLDYIVASEKLRDGAIQKLPSLEMVASINGYSIYRLP